jgi:hypothetical protein
MKIKTLINRLQNILEKDGNVEVFLADSYISCNHQYGEIKDFELFKHWHATEKGDKEGILLGKENPDDEEPPTNIDEDDEY